MNCHGLRPRNDGCGRGLAMTGCRHCEERSDPGAMDCHGLRPRNDGGDCHGLWPRNDGGAGLAMTDDGALDRCFKLGYLHAQRSLQFLLNVIGYQLLVLP